MLKHAKFGKKTEHEAVNGKTDTRLKHGGNEPSCENKQKRKEERVRSSHRNLKERKNKKQTVGNRSPTIRKHRTRNGTRKNISKNVKFLTESNSKSKLKMGKRNEKLSKKEIHGKI